MTDLYDHDAETDDGPVTLTRLQARGVLLLIRKMTFEDPHYAKIAGEISDELMGQGVR